MATATTNRLLAALPSQIYDRLLPHLEAVSFAPEQVLYQPGGRIDHVYFPETAVVTKLVILEDGASVEVGMVGREGMTGLCIFLEGDLSPFRTVVQVAGPAHRLAASLLLQELDRSGNELQNLLRRYTASFLAQVSYLAACNQFHPVKMRCCRTLLSVSDRLGSADLPLTQEALALLLGVRRASVGEVMGELKKDRLVSYTRGRIMLLDRPGLESSVCACYRHIRDVAGRVFEPGEPGPS